MDDIHNTTKHHIYISVVAFNLSPPHQYMIDRLERAGLLIPFRYQLSILPVELPDPSRDIEASGLVNISKLWNLIMFHTSVTGLLLRQ